MKNSILGFDSHRVHKIIHIIIQGKSFMSKSNTSPNPDIHWVSLADEIPKDGIWLLAYSPKSGRHIAWYDDKSKFVSRNRNKLIGITHWMYIPEPPSK